MVVEYDGAPFSGWQIQTRLAPEQTVQGALQLALEAMLGHPVWAKAASRTDAGVHARGQVVAFETPKTNIPPIGFERGLRRFLPDAITIRSAEEADPGFNPKHVSRGKRYRYTFWNSRSPSALERSRSWWIRGQLDLEAMAEAAELLVGTHDFEAFRSSGCAAKHAIRTIYQMEITPGDYDRVYLDVVGNAFCRNMVRIFAGNLAEVGLLRRSAADIARVLASRDRTQGGMTAPPQGLCLEEVIFDDRLPERPRDTQIDSEEDEEP